MQSRKDFYDWLAKEIKIDGIIDILRDHAFDDKQSYRSGGIRLIYQSNTSYIKGLKDGILLEAGFDTVTPNSNLTISSWAFDKARGIGSISILDNSARNIACYHPGYTFVEKLQTIATKFRQEQNNGELRPNLMRQYYDIYCLLDTPQVLEFIGTKEYHAHKEQRFPKEDLAIPIGDNEASLLSTPELRMRFKKRFEATAALYYKGQPAFADIIRKIKEHIERL